MLDERCLHLLNLINNECNGSGYKVFEISDLTSAFPTRLSMDNDAVRDCINTLSQREYISVKYEDETEICVLPLSKGRFLAEKSIDEEVLRAKEVRRYFLYSFFGALTGGAVASTLGIIVSFLVK